MSYPPNCGAKYAYLLPPDSGLYTSEWEYADSLGKAKQANQALLDAWNSIMAVENERQKYPVTDRWRAAHNAWIEEYAALPEPWDLQFLQESLAMIDAGERIKNVRNICGQAACLLDAMITDGNADYGDRVVAPPAPYEAPPEPGAFDFVKDAAKVAGVAVGTLILLGVALAVFDRARKKG